ncbi:MAG TPA: four helix bundle protein [Tepidisphaeraceae bacterium]|jgi:four helix bundle protein
MGLKSYRELDAWKRAIDLVEAIYRLTRELPDGERFGLTSQSQRAAVSIPANIAEGYGRANRKEYVHFLHIARGSLMELETHLTLIGRLYSKHRDSAAECWTLTQEVGRLLGRLIRSLRPHPKP